MKYYTADILSEQTGLSLIGATLQVVVPGTTTRVTLYATDDEGGATVNQPVPNGVGFFAPDGRYDLIAIVGTRTRRVPLVDMFDGFEQNRRLEAVENGEPGALGSLRADLLAPTGTGKVGWRSSAAGALQRALASKLEDFGLSVTEFMTPSQIAAARGRGNPVDCTDAFNAAFEQARVQGRTVTVPDGIYLCGNLLFGTQNTLGQSSSPLGLQGQSKIGTIIRALPGLTGTLLKSWSLAGISFQDFTIDTTGTSAQAWDCSWKAGAGPSTQCIIRHILISGSGAIPAGVPHLDLDDMNDTYPTDVTVRIPDDEMATSCAISAVQSGGLTILRGCIWSLGYLRIGCQNGKLDGCWGHGIEFAAGCINNIEVSAGYIYGNPTHQTLFWSESDASFQSVRAIKFTSTQFITSVVPIDNYFDLSAYSMIKIEMPEFIGPTTKLLGDNSQPDSFSNVIVKIEGGKHDGHLVLNEPPGFEVYCEGLMNDMTGRMVTKDIGGSFMPVLRDGIGLSDAVFSNRVGSWYRQGNTIYFEIRITWSGASNTTPLVVGLVGQFPTSHIGPAGGNVSLQFAANTFPGVTAYPALGGSNISFYNSNGSFLNTPPSGDLLLTGHYRVGA